MRLSNCGWTAETTLLLYRVEEFELNLQKNAVSHKMSCGGRSNDDDTRCTNQSKKKKVLELSSLMF